MPAYGHELVLLVEGGTFWIHYEEEFLQIAQVALLPAWAVGLGSPKDGPFHAVLGAPSFQFPYVLRQSGTVQVLDFLEATLVSSESLFEGVFGNTCIELLLCPLALRSMN